jgi:hypothetical protein
MTRLIISFSGFKGSGKNTAAKILSEIVPVTHMSFAAPLKDATAAMFGWPRDLLEGNHSHSRKWREQPDTFWSEAFGRPVSPRWVLQYLGTDVVRHHLLDSFWIRAVQKSIDQTSDNVVLTDARFPNELGMIKALGGHTVLVKRGQDPNWYPRAAKFNRLPKWTQRIKLPFDSTLKAIHPSEREWVGYPFDHVITNHEDQITDLKKQLESLVFKLIN